MDAHVKTITERFGAGAQEPEGEGREWGGRFTRCPEGLTAVDGATMGSPSRCS